MTRIVVLSGGGIKTAVAAATVAAEHELTLLHVDFGQPSAGTERGALGEWTKTLPRAKIATVDLPHMAELRSDQSGARGLTGSQRKAGSTASVSCYGLLPVMLTLAVQCAQRLGATSVVTGLSRFCDATHLGLFGAGGRVECLREFVHSFNVMVDSLHPRGAKVSVDAPLMDMSYSDVIRLGRHLDVPLESTWTCERSGPRPCNQCEPCKKRSGAYEASVAPTQATA